MSTGKASAQTWERVIGSSAVVLSFAGCFWAREMYRPIGPVMAAYLLEAVVVSIVCGACIWWSRDYNSSPPILGAWAAVGLLSGITVMGLWSIGILFMPSDVMFITAAVMVANRRDLPIHLGLATYALAALGQAALMFR